MAAIRTRLTLASAIAASLALSGPVWSQTSGDSGMELEEVVVTARKREENLQDIPVAITAISSDDILEGGITSLEDVSTLASGFYFFNQGQSQPGRYNTQLRFRGLNQAQFSPSFETGALFVDGVYVLNGGTSLSLMDIERVEVIKGPQSAYFGRNTFGGAVNFITKNPDLEEFHGTVDVAYGNRGRFEGNVFLEGPIVPGKLSGSLGVRYYDKRGHYQASDGGRLGNEETVTFNGKLYFEPTENFRMSARISYSEDDDGAPAQAYVAGQVDANDSCTGRTITTGAGETVNPISFVCGNVPDIGEAQPVFGSGIVDGNTIIPGFIFDGLTSGPRPNGAPFVDDIGLKRESLRISASATLDLANDYSLDAIFGYNDQAANWIRDFDLSGFSNSYSQDPQGLEDTSFEVRLTSPQDGKIRWAIGANYYDQEFTSSGAGGNFAFACLGTGNPAFPCVPGFGLNFPNSLQNADESEVFGIFASVDYDITDQLTFTAEGRYQEDELVKGGLVGEEGLIDGATKVKSDEFLPRFILRWQPNDNITVYGSYAEGVVNGDVNQQFLNADAREREQYLAQFPGLGESTPTEELESWEIGLKATFWNGRAYTNVSAFTQEWIGIKGRSSAQVNETCDASGPNSIGAPGCTYDGVMPGDPKLIVDPSTGQLIPFLNSRNILLDGDADIKGFEVEAGAALAEGWTVDAAIAYVDTEYTRYQFNFVQRIAGFADMRGNATPRTPEWSGNMSTTYRFPIRDFTGYVRADVNYVGEVFTDETNLARLDSYFMTNLRTGVEMQNYRIELFVRNLFDEDAWATGARFSDTAFPTDFTNFFVQQGFNLTPQDKREVGLRGVITF